MDDAGCCHGVKATAVALIALTVVLSDWLDIFGPKCTLQTLWMAFANKQRMLDLSRTSANCSCFGLL